MEWIDRLNATINYMEEHLTDEIDLEEIAKIAYCSVYHYQRMFIYMSGIPLSEYIRRRKMSLAAVELQKDDSKIIDISLKYGYSSPTAFNRAFKSVHGIAPSMLKNEGISITAFPPLTFKMTIKGVEQMNYRIETKEAFRIVGISQPLHKDLEKNFEIVPTMWQTVATNGTLPKLAGMINTEMKGLLGLSICNDEEEWKYFIAVASTANCDQLEEYIIPSATWAIFDGAGDNISIQELERRIVTEWLPTSGYEYANAPDIEVYLNPDPQNAIYEVWIPVKRK